MLNKLYVIKINWDFRASWHLAYYRKLDPLHRHTVKGANALGPKRPGFGF